MAGDGGSRFLFTQPCGAVTTRWRDGVKKIFGSNPAATGKDSDCGTLMVAGGMQSYRSGVLAPMTGQPISTQEQRAAVRTAGRPAVWAALPSSRYPWERHRLLPPSDGFHVVVASAARAVCADRAMSRGLPRRSTKVRLPSSCMPHAFCLTGSTVSTRRSCRGRETFKSPVKPQYSGGLAGIRIQL